MKETMDIQRLAELASTPLGQIVLVGIGMLLFSRGYPALVARWPGLAPYLGLLARLFPDAAPRSGEALWELYRSTMNGRAINGRPLPSWADLDAAQRAAYDAMAHGLALAPIAAKPSDKAPPGMLTLSLCIGVLTFAACSGLGCGGAAAKFEAVAHSARDVAVVAEACSFAAKEQAMAECKTDQCKADVLRKYAPIADVLDAFNDSWCAVEPGVGGCK